jgi:low affinity Fe/Cu permease
MGVCRSRNLRGTVGVLPARNVQLVCHSYWYAIATLAAWFMTLVIQRAEHRDTQAIHAKLDEILHALGDARNEVTKVDEWEPEEIEEHRRNMRKND